MTPARHIVGTFAMAISLVVGCGDDASRTSPDGGTDSGGPEDASPLDAPTVVDAGTDSSADAGADTDAGADSGTDAGADSGTDAAMDSGTDAGAGSDAGADTDAGTDAGTPARSDHHVHIYVSNTCEMTVVPSEVTIPEGQTAYFDWHNHSDWYAVDVWMSYGGGYLDLETGAIWDEPIGHCSGPSAVTEYADISTACSEHRFQIHCE